MSHDATCDTEQQQEDGSDTDRDDAGRVQGKEGKRDDRDKCCQEVSEEHPDRLHERTAPVIPCDMQFEGGQHLEQEVGMTVEYIGDSAACPCHPDRARAASL